jgi:hypothetical protein
MRQIISLFESTKVVWNISRWLLILLFFSSFLKVHKDAPLADNILNGSSLIFIILLALCLPEKNRTGKYRRMRFVTGGMAIIYGLGMYILVTRLETRVYSYSVSWMYLVAIWVFLFGIWDVLCANQEIKG